MPFGLNGAKMLLFLNINVMRKLILLTALLFSNFALADEKIRCGDEASRKIFVDMKANEQKIRQEYFKVLKERNLPLDHPEMVAMGKTMDEIDASNQATLDRVIATCGWPNYTNFGYDAVSAAELIVVHAKDKKKYFPFIEVAFKTRQASAELYAVLIDKMLMDEGKPQRYGTQVHIVTKELAPMEDPAHVNDRRQEIDLYLLNNYPDPQTKNPADKKKIPFTKLKKN